MNMYQMDDAPHRQPMEHARRGHTLSKIAELRAAARQYASRLGSDDATYVRAFLTAINAGMELADMTAGDITACRPATTFVPSIPLLNDPQFAANARSLYSSDDRTIIAIRELHPSEYRDRVSIRDGKTIHGGSLVARNLVVTAAHCVQDRHKELEIITSMQSTEEISRIEVHPGYDPASGANDIAVIVLRGDIAGIPPVELAREEEMLGATHIRAVGWQSDVLSDYGSVMTPRYAIDLPVTTFNYIRSASQKSSYDSGFEFVAGKPALLRESCFATDGAPCYLRHGRQWKLAGIASRPVQEYHAPGGDGDIYMRTDRYSSWISAIAGGRW